MVFANTTSTPARTRAGKRSHGTFQKGNKVNALKLSSNTDRRGELRREYAGHILFAAANRVHEGTLKNFSRFGLFIESSLRVAVGDRITIALPHGDDKRTGRVVWRNPQGFGVSLLDPGSPCRLDEPSAKPFRKRISAGVGRLFGNP